MIMKKRVTIYIDGFNFYYGLKRIKSADVDWRKYYWIDYVKLFEQFVGPDQELAKVVYFTASPLSPSKNSRQSALLNANKLLHPDKFEVVRGKYIGKTIECPHCKFAISKPEEKRTDVNLSVRMMGDCFMDKTDILVLVSADSDLVPPIEFIQSNHHNKKVKVYFPPANFSNDLKDNIIMHKWKPILLERNKIKFENSIMPERIDINGKIVTIPDKWK